MRDRVVVVTGAGSGIGAATALAFAKAGAKVVGLGRDQARLQKIADKLDLVLTMDVTRPESVEIAAAAILDRYGRVDVLINNAGVGLFVDEENTSEEALRELMEVNFFGMRRVTRAFSASLLENKGVLVQVASVAGLRGYARHTAYCASKHALIGWSEALRVEWGPKGASVVIVCPPAIDTPFFDNAGYADFRKDHRGLRLLPPETVATAILDAVEHRRHRVIIGLRAKLLYALFCVAPGVIERVRG